MTRLVKSLIDPSYQPLGVSVMVCTRSVASATRVNERGLMELCAANSPRFDYDPVTLACRGLLIEEQRTNLILQSQNFGLAWAAGGTPTRVANALFQGGSPLSMPLDLLGDDSSTAFEFFIATPTFTGNAVKAFSWFAKKGTSPGMHFKVTDVTAAADRLRASVDWSSAGIPTVTMHDGTLLGIDDYGNGIYRFRVLSTTITAANTHQVQVFPACTSALSASTIGDTYIGGVQAENAEFCSSYIPTNETTVTRNADNFDETSVSPWFNSTEGSFVAQAMLNNIGATGNAVVMAVDDNTANEMYRFRFNRATGAQAFRVQDASTTQADITPSGGAVNNTPANFAAAYKTNDFAHSINGAAAVLDTNGTLPTVTRWRWGRDPNGDYLNGWLRLIRVYRTRLVNADLQTQSNGGSRSSITEQPWLEYDFTGGQLEASPPGALNKPKIAWHTYTRDRTVFNVVTSSEDPALFPRDAPLRQQTYEGWKPLVTGATWRVDLGNIVPIDYFFILGSGTKVAIELSNDAVNWRWMCGGLDLDLYPSAATLVLVPRTLGRHARVTMESIGLMNVFMTGLMLTMPYMVGGFGPPTLTRETERSTSDSRSGQFLGATIRRMGFTGSVNFTNLSPVFVRTVLDPFIQSARLYEYVFSWNPADNPEDVVYARTLKPIHPRYISGRPHLMEVNWDLEGFDG